MKMELKSQNIGAYYRIKELSEIVPCNNCEVCTRLRVMDLGLIPGSLVQITKHDFGLWILNLLSDKGTIETTVALRDEEAERLILEDEECFLKFEKLQFTD